MTRRQKPEEALHRAAARHLTLALPSDAWWCHVPNGGARSKAEAGVFKALGVKAGTPDLLIVHQGRALWIELKPEGGRLSANQVACHYALKQAAAPVAVCRSLEDIEETLVEWGLVPRAVVETARSDKASA